ncbi:MAG: hypothetical protein ABH836_05125 [Candidatus Omnitrophota bacterium]
MEREYAEGFYIESSKKYEGVIAVDGSKLYLKTGQGNLTDTYLPLDKIQKIKKLRRGIEITVKLSAVNGYMAVIRSKKQPLAGLIKYLVNKLNMKKKFLKREWIGDVSWR